MATVSMYDATHGYAAKTTAARDAKGNIVGDSTGSKYARQQEAQEAQKAQAAQAAQTAAQQAQAQKQAPAYSTIYQQQNELLQAQIKAVEAERAPVPKTESIVSKVASKIGVKDQLDTANKNLSAYIPTLETIQEKRDTALEKVGLLDERQRVTEAIRSNQLTAGIQNYYLGGYKGLKETPVSFAAGQGVLLAGGAVGGAVLKGVGLAGRVGLTKIGLSKLAGAVEPTINVGLGAATVYEASKIKTVEEGAGFVSDIALMGVGYKTGTKASLKAYDRLRTIESQKVLPESIISKNVLSGKEQFPTTRTGANAQDVLNSFKDPTGNFFGYHATTGKIRAKVGNEVSRPTDVPGLYVSPLEAGASPHFLRISGEQKSAASTLLEGVKTLDVSKIKTGIIGTSDPLEPQVLKISLNEVGRLPEKARYYPEKAQSFLLSPDAPKGTAFLTPVLEKNIRLGGRAEAEAIIVPETTLRETTLSKKYFEIEGRRVELKEYKTIDSGKISNKELSQTGKELLTADELTKTYRGEYSGSKGLIQEIAYPTIRYSPEIAEPRGYDPIPSEPRIIEPRTIDTRIVEPRGYDPIPSEPRIIEPRTIDTRIIEPRGYDPIPSEPRGNDPIPPEPRIIIPRSIDPIPPEPKIIDPINFDPIPPPPEKNIPVPPNTLEFHLDTQDPLSSKNRLKKPKQKMIKNIYGDPFSTKTKL